MDRASYLNELDRNSFAKECEARGEVRGIHKANVATALRLRQMGMNDNQISLATGLPFDEIKNL